MTEARPTSRPVYYILLVCLALGLFLAGFVAGHFHAFHHGPPPPSPEAIAANISHNMPGPDAAIIREAFKANADKITAALAALQASRQAVRGALGADPLDRAAVEAAMKDAREKRDLLAQTVQGTILQTLGQLSPEGRRRIWSGPPH